EYKTLGNKAPLLMSGAAAGKALYVGAAGSAANGTLITASMAQVWPYLPRSSAARKLDASLSHHIPPGGYNQALDDACGAATVLTQAILRVGSNANAIQRSILRTPTVACSGLYNYVKTKHVGLSASEVWLMKVVHGKFVPTKWSLAHSSAG
ncbi:MAG: hypothetical protein ACRDZ5_09510, partial [Acidimicrobiales bacterium]